MNKLTIIIALIFVTALLNGQTKSSIKNVGRPFILGKVHELKSKELGENRVLNIYLPEGYDPKGATTYPVIYLLDGSADEDFIHIVGLVQFNSFEWVGQIPKSIVVGIATVDRRRDFTFPTTIIEDRKNYPTSGASQRFIDFIEKELQPYIDSQFKTSADKTIIGQSLGGLLASEIVYKMPALFNRYIIISPSLWWNNGSLLDQPLPNLQKIDIYIGVGKEGLAPTKSARVMEVDANILADKIKNNKGSGVSVFFDYLPEENHATIMHQAVSNSFKRLYSKKE